MCYLPQFNVYFRINKTRGNIIRTWTFFRIGKNAMFALLVRKCGIVFAQFLYPKKSLYKITPKNYWRFSFKKKTNQTGTEKTRISRMLEGKSVCYVLTVCVRRRSILRMVCFLNRADWRLWISAHPCCENTSLSSSCFQWDSISDTRDLPRIKTAQKRHTRNSTEIICRETSSKCIGYIVTRYSGYGAKQEPVIFGNKDRNKYNFYGFVSTLSGCGKFIYYPLLKIAKSSN